MKRLYTSESLAEVGHYRNLLEQAGIDCIIRNEQLSGAIGGIPVIDCLPELWVVNDEDLPRAKDVVEQQQKPVDAPSWYCQHCGELNEGQFAVCWHCGTADGQEPGP